MNKKAELIVVGSANMDVVAATGRMPAGGETILVGDVSLVNGGKGANAAVAAARLGANVRFVGAVGDDAFGTALRQGLIDNNIDCEYLQFVSGASGTAIILIDEETRQNRILVGPGANFHFAPPSDVEFYRLADVLMLQLEVPLEVTLQAARLAKKAGTKVVLDPAPAVADIPHELVALCDIISPNESEMAILTGCCVDSLEDVEVAARKLLDMGAGEVVAKMGSRGAMWVGSSFCEFCKAVEVDVVDTTAAGDSFTGALAVCMAEGLSRREALRRAIAAGSIACTRPGAQTSLPNREEVERVLAKE